MYCVYTCCLYICIYSKETASSLRQQWRVNPAVVLLLLQNNAVNLSLLQNLQQVKITFSAAMNIYTWVRNAADDKNDLIKVFAEIRLSGCCWLRGYSSAETQPHLQQMHGERKEQLYKSRVSHPARGKSNWFQITFSKGSFQVHR